MGPIIDLTTLFPWRVIILFAYSFAYYNIVHAILKDKIHPLLTFTSIFALRIALSVILFHSENLNAIGFPLFLILSFVLILFLTTGKIWEKLTVTIFYFINHFVTSAMLSVIIGIIYGGKNYEEIFGNENLNLDYLYIFLVEVICYISMSFLFSGILKLFAAKKSKHTNKKLYAYLSFLPLSHIFTVIIALFLASGGNNQSADFGMAVNILVYTLIGIILIFDCSFPFIADHFEKMESNYVESKKELSKSKLKYEQTKLMKEEIQEIRKVKHDFLNITSTAKSFIENGSYDKACDILDKTNTDLNISSSFYICANDTLNTILYIKQKLASQNSVKLSIDITENAKLNIDDYSISRIMHNIIDNAIKASAETEEKDVTILITIDEEKLSFICQNHFNNLNSQKSKKKNTKEHGYGIGIIKELVKKYNGSYYSNTDDNLYYTKIDMQNIEL